MSDGENGGKYMNTVSQLKTVDRSGAMWLYHSAVLNHLYGDKV